MKKKVEMVKVFQYITRGKNEITDDICLAVEIKLKPRRKLST